MENRGLLAVHLTEVGGAIYVAPSLPPLWHAFGVLLGHQLAAAPSGDAGHRCRQLALLDDITAASADPYYYRLVITNTRPSVAITQDALLVWREIGPLYYYCVVW